MDLGPKLNKPLSYATTTRILVIFLAIALSVLYQRICHHKNNLTALRETVEIQQEQIEIWTFLSESLHTKTQTGFQEVGSVLENHSGVLLETVAALDAQQKLGEELVASLEEVYHNTAMAFPKVLEEVSPAVMGIVWHTNDPNQSHGTGALINCWEGHVLTAKHVIDYRDEDPNLYYVVMGGEKVRIVEIFKDPQEDLAILVLDIQDPNYVPSMEMALAEPNSTVRGQLVLNLGHPYGLGLSASSGIVSLPDSEHTNFGLSEQDIFNKVSAPRMQYDAAANPGNSGGPVINLDGEIEGICVSGKDGCPRGVTNAGVNFAVPVSEILKSLERFEQWRVGDLVIEEPDRKQSNIIIRIIGGVLP